MQLRSAFGYDQAAVSLETGLSCPPDEGRTQQQFAEEADINTIVRRFGLTGELPVSERSPLPPSEAFYDVVDYHTAMLAIRRADEAFYDLPAEVRRRFANDPARLLGFLDDPANRAEATALGIVQAKASSVQDPAVGGMGGTPPVKTAAQPASGVA
ncbi:MAG: internal scaffolding protein [Microvirus sp.]|nr:MAG: internal scaffolding protein [Microvirus sp.]